MTTLGHWAEAGPDECSFCLRAYYVEVGYYCADCDRPVCPVCVVTRFEWQTVSCPECSTGGKR